jgi:hypothetical protein
MITRSEAGCVPTHGPLLTVWRALGEMYYVEQLLEKPIRFYKMPV